MIIDDIIIQWLTLMESAPCSFSWPTKCAIWPTKLQSVWPFGQLSKIIIFNSGLARCQCVSSMISAGNSLSHDGQLVTDSQAYYIDVNATHHWPLTSAG